MRELLNELARLREAAKLGPMVSVHIINPGYEHCANLCTRLEGHKSDYPVAMMQSEWADVIAATMNAFPALLAYVRELERERDAARKENDFMRLRLAESDKACAYCDLPKAEMGRCASGFPGCARADDLFQCDELTRRDAQQRREGAATHLDLMAERSKNDCMKNEYRAEAQRLREGK